MMMMVMIMMIKKPTDHVCVLYLNVNEKSFDRPIWIVHCEVVIQHLHQQQLL